MTDKNGKLAEVFDEDRKAISIWKMPKRKRETPSEKARKKALSHLLSSDNMSCQHLCWTTPDIHLFISQW